MAQYAIPDGRKTTLRMHRLIMQPTPAQVVDHVNGNTLDNRRSNLRVTDTMHNLRRQKVRKNNTSGFKGVQKKRNRFLALICDNYKHISLGHYDTALEAAKIYDAEALKRFGEFAKTNKMMGLY